MLASRWATPPAADSAKPEATEPQHQQHSPPSHENNVEQPGDLSSPRDGTAVHEPDVLEHSTAQPAALSPSTSAITNVVAAAPDDASSMTSNFATTPLVAPPEAPAPAVYSVDPMADEFAQTREDDDLFDDDFTPVAEPVVEVDLTPVPVDDETAVTSSSSDAAAEIAAALGGGAPPSHNHHSSGPVDVVARPPPTGPSAGARGARDGGFRGGRGRGNRGGRGGARGGASPGGLGGLGGLAGSRFAPSTPTNGTPNREKEVAQGGGNAEAEGEQQVVTDGQEGDNKDAAGKLAARKEGAVRGDRSATGGIKKDRLTEEQLAARMSAIKLKNESLTAAHARAEADLAQYQAREKEAAAKAAQRAKADRQNRQVMMGERERNRMRKLNAQSGREWDLDKEEGFGGTERGARGARRGAHGGVVGSRGATNGAEAESTDGAVSTSNDLSHEPQNGQARGGRGGRRGGGGGRRASGSGHHPAQAAPAPAPQAIPTPLDFPKLPYSSAPSDAAPKKETAATPQLSFPNAKQATSTNGTATTDVPAGEKETDATQKNTKTEAEPSQAKSEPDAAKDDQRPDPPARIESFGISSLKGTSWADQVDGEE